MSQRVEEEQASEKVKVVIEVDPNQETTILPFGEQLSESVRSTSKGITGSGTGSNVGGTPDADVDVDF